MDTSNNDTCPSAITEVRDALRKPSIPIKRFRIINGQITKICTDEDSISNDQSGNNDRPISKDSEPENSDDDVNDCKEHSESETNSEMETLSKPDCISRECLSYIGQVHDRLTNILQFKEELDKEFPVDSEQGKYITNVFRDIKMLKAVYGIIDEKINILRGSEEASFYLYDVLLDTTISNMLKIYKAFLSQYATNAKWMGDFIRENQGCMDACTKARSRFGIADNINIDNCLYTVFNSLFSLELMFDRYRKCFDEATEQFLRASDAKNLISKLLSAINTNQDQANFMLTQKELNLLTGRSRDSKINTRFLHKGIATKFARRDDKPLSRQLVLFTDCLYVTLLPGNIVGSSSVRQELSVSSMKVEEIQDEENGDSGQLRCGLTVHAREAVQDFFFENVPARKVWMDKILLAIREETTACNADNLRVSSWLISLGKVAPRWQKDTAAGYCNGHRCKQKFNASSRRHHCRADGLLYCVSCCNYKVKLEFERSSESKVCELCYKVITAVAQGNKREADEFRGMLEVVMSRRNHEGKKTGWLLVRTYNKEKNSFLPEAKYFCVLDTKDAFLRLYEKHEDKQHWGGIILLGMEVRTMLEGSRYYRALTGKQFMIQHENKDEVYLIKAASADECQKWVECLKQRIRDSSEE